MPEVTYNAIVKDYDDYDDAKLGHYNLPVIQSVNQLLSMINFTSEDERKFLYSSNRGIFLYHQHEVPKRNGKGMRKIESPHPRLKTAQQMLNKLIFSKFHMSKSCHGFVKERSILTNALPHVEAKTLMKFDIKDFFPSITLDSIVKQLRFFGYGVNVSRCLGLLCVNANYCLPQGAPTSPYLANLICIKIDKRIEGYCQKYNYVYTRYADDITISSKEIVSEYRFHKVQEFLCSVLADKDEKSQLRLNTEKSHRFINGQKMVVTGIVVNSKASVNKSICRELENAIRYIKLFGVVNHLKHLDLQYDVETYKLHLYGLANFINMVNPEKGISYIEELDQLCFSEE